MMLSDEQCPATAGIETESDQFRQRQDMGEDDHSAGSGVLQPACRGSRPGGPHRVFPDVAGQGSQLAHTGQAPAHGELE